MKLVPMHEDVLGELRDSLKDQWAMGITMRKFVMGNMMGTIMCCFGRMYEEYIRCHLWGCCSWGFDSRYQG